MQDTSVAYWSWSMPRPARRHSAREPGRRPTLVRSQGGWVRPATPAKCAPTVFIGAPMERREIAR